jgi:translation initiation factor 1|tara:strand:+ start:12970 stop:13266 length:297 start_codon:yes stop_codon:yes gene_type:complete
MKDFESFLPNSLTDVLETLDKERTPLKMKTDRRAYGKKVTLVSGFDKTTDVKKVAKLLKSKCATGGTVKDSVIELQGDQVRRATEILEKEDYQVDFIR